MTSYTKRGPFVDGSPTGPYIDAGFFNGTETAFAGAFPTNAVNGITGWFHAEQYGAVGNGTTNDRVAIQAAITAANAAYTTTGSRQRVYLPPRTHLVDTVTYLKDDGTTQGITSLLLLDGVELSGPGTIKVKANAYGAGAFYRAITAKSGGVSNAVLADFTIDGDRANQTASAQCSNIDVPAVSGVTVRNVRSVNANGVAIRLLGTTTVQATNLKVLGCTVLNASYIGIQVSHFTGADIGDNYVNGTGDNGIDVYGEDGDSTTDSADWTIHDNIVVGSTTGAFIETVSYGSVHDNAFTSCSAAGVRVNRINGRPEMITVHHNSVRATPVGFMVTGDAAGVIIDHNTVAGATTACVQLGSGNGNVSRVYVLDNNLDTSTGALPLVLAAGNVISKVRIRGTFTSTTDATKNFVNTATTTSDVTAQAFNA